MEKISITFTDVGDGHIRFAIEPDITDKNPEELTLIEVCALKAFFLLLESPIFNVIEREQISA